MVQPVGAAIERCDGGRASPSVADAHCWQLPNSVAAKKMEPRSRDRRKMVESDLKSRKKLIVDFQRVCGRPTICSAVYRRV